MKKQEKKQSKKQKPENKKVLGKARVKGSSPRNVQKRPLREHVTGTILAKENDVATYKCVDTILPRLLLDDEIEIRIELGPETVSLYVGPRDYQWQRSSGIMLGCGTVAKEEEGTSQHVSDEEVPDEVFEESMEEVRQKNEEGTREFVHNDDSALLEKEGEEEESA